jgi:hypothetical protein
MEQNMTNVTTFDVKECVAMMSDSIRNSNPTLHSGDLARLFNSLVPTIFAKGIEIPESLFMQYIDQVLKSLASPTELAEIAPIDLDCTPTEKFSLQAVTATSKAALINGIQAVRNEATRIIWLATEQAGTQVYLATPSRNWWEEEDNQQRVFLKLNEDPNQSVNLKMILSMHAVELRDGIILDSSLIN